MQNLVAKSFTVAELWRFLCFKITAHHHRDLILFHVYLGAIVKRN